MILVLFHVLYSLSRYFYRNYARFTTLCDDAREPLELEVLDEVALRDEDVPVPKNQLRFSPPAYIQRYNAVVNVLAEPRYEGKMKKVVDFGCAELGFLVYLKNLADVEEVLCVDIDEEILESNICKAKPYTIDFINRRKQPLVIEICRGNVIENDTRLQNIDAVICIELIEHMYPDELMHFPCNIFEYIMPKVAIITTPNADFNVLFPNFSGYRHPDHKFEWTRQQFQDWAQNIVTRYPSYSVTFHGICYGPEGTEELGACSQMAVFHLESQEERIPLPGVDGLFKTVDRIDYPVHKDSRTDEQKIVDEAIYYIHFLSYNGEEQMDEIPLELVLSFIPNISIAIETLKLLLIEHGITIEDREGGPVVLPFEQTTSNSCDSDSFEPNVADDFLNDTDIAIDWNETDFDCPTSMNEVLKADEESLLLQVPHTNDWNEECSIFIPQNRSVVLENTYLFDGEVSSAGDFYVSEKSNHNIDDLAQCNDSVEGFSSNSIPPALNDKELSDKTQIIQSDARTIMLSAIPSSSSNTATKQLLDFVKIESALSQEDELNLKSIQRTAATLNCQPHLSVSRSSTSPEPLYLSFELNNSLQNYSTNQNDSYQNEYLLNSTFRQSEIDETIENVEYAECGQFNTNPVQEDYSQKTKVNLLENASNTEENSSNNIERVTALKNLIYDNTNVTDKTLVNNGTSFQNKPKFTSSPRKMPTILKDKDFVPVNSNTLSNITEAIGGIGPVLDTNTSLLAEPSEISGSVVETVALCTAPNSNNTDKSTASTQRSTDRFANETQQALCSENQGNHISTKDGTNREFAMESNIIDHETDVDNVQNTDVNVSSQCHMTIQHEEKNITSTLSNLDDVNAKAYLDNVLASDHDSQTNISKRSLSPPKGFLSSKLRRNSKCSSECAKEANILETKFTPCTSTDDASNVQSASVSRNEENSGSATKELASRDVNMSNISKPVDNVETKASSPLETPPNSWSPEIMDSGYPNTASAQDITPEYDLSSIAQDHIPDSESPSVAEAPRFGILEPIEVENGDLANNNRDDEGNNMIAVDVDDNEDLQPFIDVLENDLENENDIYVMQNGFPMWLLRLLDIDNPPDFDGEFQLNLRANDEVEDDAYDSYEDYYDEGFDGNSSGDSDIIYSDIDDLIREE